MSASPFSLVPITHADHPTLQNMARFYVYDLSRYCGKIGPSWQCPEDGLYECINLDLYIETPNKHAFFIKVGDQFAGFVLINQSGLFSSTQWNMGEFFILAAFQGTGLAMQVATHCFQTFPGNWEISVIPENLRGLAFWRKAISHYVGDHYTETMETVHYDIEQDQRYILRFDSTMSSRPSMSPAVRIAEEADLPAMVELARIRRTLYAKTQPVFWRAAQDADKKQHEWFQSLLRMSDAKLWVAEQAGEICGFLIGQIVPAPAVYDPGGATISVDDFCVVTPMDWCPVGGMLLAALKGWARSRDVVQIVVVCGAHDIAKKQWLIDQNMLPVSIWYRGELTEENT